jgi:CDP-diacylglycerol pyrophosphatase
MKVWMLKLLALISLAASLLGDVSGCACDVARPEALAARQCSLCREAEKQPADAAYFFLKDSHPLKPNRWLLLPRSHGPDGPQPLAHLPAAERARLWTAAIARARELWGGQWGVAINGDEVRTQCHTHIHIGRLLEGVETGRLVVVAGPAQIPVPRDGTGLWIHPYGQKLHVHLGEQAAETVLAR